MTPDLATVLTDLRAAFEADHAAIERAAQPLASVPANVCRYCGRFRAPWSGCELDGHAKCYVSPAFKQHLHQEMQGRAQLTFAVVSRELGVSLSIVRAWYHQVERMRGAA